MKSVKSLLLLLILSTLLASFTQYVTRLVHEAPLKGYFVQKDRPKLKMFTWHGWLSNSFQEQYSSRLAENIGFRNTIIRIGNQYNYSLFGMISASGFVQGKNRYLFEEDYIHEYNGDFFIGNRAISRKLSRLKNATDSLKSHGIPLLLVYEPGKATYYPEYIPSQFRPGHNGQTNYQCFLEGSRELGMPFIDLNAWFLRMKDTARIPLFPRYGMHWSESAVPLAVDTIARYLEKTTGRDLPSFRITSMKVSEVPKGTDNDIGEILNLLIPLKPATGYYPEIGFDPQPKPALKVLVVADSYYLNIIEKYGRKLFASQDYWYYNKKLYPYQNNNPPAYVDKSDLRNKLLKYDAIVLMASEINLHCGFWNFADEAFSAFHPENRDSKVYSIENEIRNDREWFRFVVNKARQEGRTQEDMIHGDAMYTFCSNYENIGGKTAIDTIYNIICKIKNDPKWYAIVAKKAQDLKIPIDSMMLRDAIYSYRQSRKMP